MHSVPPWLAELWFAERGPEQARALLAAINRPAESSLRVNTLRAESAQVRAQLPVASHPVAGLPEALVLEGPFDVRGSPLWRAGAIMAQSRGSMGPARTLAPASGQRVLDLCAAPGAKTTHLAALMGADGELDAVERNPGRARGLAATLARMGADFARVHAADAGVWPPEPRCDAVLVDPPCSGLGTLQSRPDLRWRTSPERIAELAEIQARILRAGAGAVASGGALVYSVCTISRAESEAVVDGFLAGAPDFHAEPVGPGGQLSQTLPHRDGTDGFFIARLRRA